MLDIIFASAIFSSTLLVSEPNNIMPSNVCAPLQGWEVIREKSQDGFLIFGELHGTEQSPEAFTEYVCAISEPNGQESGDSVLIAIEFDSIDDMKFRKAWEASEDDFITEITNNISDWQWRKDGVASKAMLASLKRLHTLKSRGHNIDITAFTGAKNDEQTEKFKHLNGQGPSEAAQAENIRNAAQKDHYDHVVILVGSLHAQKTNENWGTGDFSPMAMKLAETQKVISLTQLYLDGSSWYCGSASKESKDGKKIIIPEDIICKTYKSRANVKNMTAPPHMSLWSEADPNYTPDYDGYYFVGNITASEPVPISKNEP